MSHEILLDTGPLVASINKRDHFHDWVCGHLAQLPPPLLTCEAVVAEACFLLRNSDGGSLAVIEMVRRGIIETPFRASDHADSILRLMKKYADVPMSLADACLVRMSELYSDCSLLTLDSDFRRYRRHGRQVIPVLMPSTR